MNVILLYLSRFSIIKKQKKSHHHGTEDDTRKDRKSLTLAFYFLKGNCLVVADKMKLYDVLKDIKNSVLCMFRLFGVRSFTHYSAFCEHTSLLLHIAMTDGLLGSEEGISTQTFTRFCTLYSKEV